MTAREEAKETPLDSSPSSTTVKGSSKISVLGLGVGAERLKGAAVISKDHPSSFKRRIVNIVSSGVLKQKKRPSIPLPSGLGEKRKVDKVVVEPVGEPSSQTTSQYYVVVENETGTDCDPGNFSGVVYAEEEREGRSGPIGGGKTNFVVEEAEIRSGVCVEHVVQQEEVMCEDKADEDLQMIRMLADPLSLGATATAEADADGVIRLVEPIPQGMKMRRSRVFGTCRCPECGQTFVNTARLERHLAVHQVFGSYLCPLCGKTYKYEYNLFYHWRKTCRDLNELMEVEDRKNMDVGSLRDLVDEVAAKKAELGTLDSPFRRIVSQPEVPPPPRSDVPQGRKGEACPECGVVVLASHMEQHMAIHRGEIPVDTKGVAGGFFCDLCGLMFRQHFNLIKHWRTGCPEIQQALDPTMDDLTMDDDALKQLVADLLKKKGEELAEGQGKVIEKENKEKVITEQSLALDNEMKDTSTSLVEDGSKISAAEVLAVSVEQERKSSLDIPTDAGLAKNNEESAGDTISRKEMEMESEEVDVTTVREIRDDEWMLDSEFGEDYNELLGDSQSTEELGPLGLGLPQVPARAKWSMLGGPVQCPECFRSFANAGRLERHLMGFHASYGTHHCILCGNRFKYDYNLLYHYRRSCPYTKAFIDRDVREQMEAASLRKLVRDLARKEVRLTPHVEPPPKLPGQAEVPIPRLAMRYPSNQPPAHLLMPRPGMPEGKTCPVCGIIFYGKKAVQRHMQAAHPVEWDQWQAASGEDDDVQAGAEEKDKKASCEPEVGSAKSAKEARADENETMPKLKPQNRRVRRPGSGVVDIAGKKAKFFMENTPLTRTPGKEAAEIDPTLESSIATFLSEMRQEAGGGPEEMFEASPYTFDSPQEAEITEYGMEVERIPENFQTSTPPRSEETEEREVITAEFEEDLDVDGDGCSTALAEVLEEVQEVKKRKRKKTDRKTQQEVGKKRKAISAPRRMPKTEPTCLECGKIFITNAHLMRHIKQQHRNCEEEERSVDCFLCGLNFREDYNLITHWRSSRCAKIRQTLKDKNQLKNMDSEEVRKFAMEVAAAEEKKKSVGNGTEEKNEKSKERNGMMKDLDVD